jgi:hypothetical protein
MALPNDVVELNNWLTTYYPDKDFFGSPDQGLDPMHVRPNSLGISTLYVLNRADYLVRYGAHFLSDVRNNLVFSNSTFLVFDLNKSLDNNSGKKVLDEILPSAAGLLLSKARECFNPGFVESLKHETQSDDYFKKCFQYCFELEVEITQPILILNWN